MRRRRNVVLLALLIAAALAPAAARHDRALTIHASVVHHSTSDAPIRTDLSRYGIAGQQLVASQPTKPRQSGVGLAIIVAVAAAAAFRPRTRRRRATPVRDHARFALRRGPPLLHTV